MNRAAYYAARRDLRVLMREKPTDPTADYADSPSFAYAQLSRRMDEWQRKVDRVMQVLNVRVGSFADLTFESKTKHRRECLLLGIRDRGCAGWPWAWNLRWGLTPMPRWCLVSDFAVWDARVSAMHYEVELKVAA